MATFYTVNKISKNMEETPEGYLLCRNVPVTRAGDFVYLKEESPFPSEFDNDVVLTRTVEELSKNETIASFEGKPVTIGHPPVDVTSDNWKEYAVGVMQNARQGIGEDQDKILVDLILTDSEAIEIVRSKKTREVSLSMRGEVIKTGENSGNVINILVNHLALALSGGRCGKICSINDSKEVQMSIKEKLMSLVGKAINDALPEDDNADAPPSDSMKDGVDSDVMDLINALTTRISAIESKINGDDNMDDEDPAVTQGSDMNDQEGYAGAATTDSDMAERLANIEAAILKLAGLAKTEGEDGGMEDCNTMNDEITVARAEILSPGIENCKNLKEKALSEAYKTDLGKKVIDGLLSGRMMDSIPDKEMLFVAASEAMKNARAENRTTSVSKAPAFSGPMTAERLNELNEQHYSSRR